MLWQEHEETMFECDTAEKQYWSRKMAYGDASFNYLWCNVFWRFYFEDSLISKGVVTRGICLGWTTLNYQPISWFFEGGFPYLFTQEFKPNKQQTPCKHATKPVLEYPSWVVVSNIFYFHPYLGKIPILTNIFQRSWNHQLARISFALENWSKNLTATPFFTTSFIRLFVALP